MKINLEKPVEESPPWVKSLLDFVELPPTVVIFSRLLLFKFIGHWSIRNSAEGGPKTMVALSLAACIYFLNKKMRSLGEALVIGLATKEIGLACGSIIVPMAVLLRPTWDPELVISLVAHVFLFLCSTFLNMHLASLLLGLFYGSPRAHKYVQSSERATSALQNRCPSASSQFHVGGSPRPSLSAAT